jgi:hypothetical protein
VVTAASFVLSTNITKVVRLVPAKKWHISLHKSILGNNTQRNRYFTPVNAQEKV